MYCWALAEVCTLLSAILTVNGIFWGFELCSQSKQLKISNLRTPPCSLTVCDWHICTIFNIKQIKNYIIISYSPTFQIKFLKTLLLNHYRVCHQPHIHILYGHIASSIFLPFVCFHGFWCCAKVTARYCRQPFNTEGLCSQPHSQRPDI